MRYLLAIIFPPLAVLLCGKPIQAVLNLPLTMFFWLPGAIHAALVVHGHHADRRARKITKAINQHQP